MYILSYYETDILGRVAIPRPVATFEKWVTGRVMQRLVLRSVGHGETGFRLRSSVFATPIGKGPCSVLCNRLCRIRAVEMGCKNRSSRSFSRHGEIALQLLRTYLSPVTRVHCTFLNIWWTTEIILRYKFAKNRHQFDNNLHAPTLLVDISSVIASHPVYVFFNYR